MMTDDLAQKSSRTLAVLVRAQRLGLAQHERYGGGTERLAGVVPGRISACYANARVFGVIRATRGG